MPRTSVGKPLFEVKISHVLNVVSALPLFGIAFCVVWSILYDFKSSTWTHCKVQNYLPTISSATGGYTPQRYIWRICVALHCFPRLLFAFSYYNFHTQIHMEKLDALYRNLAKLCSLFHCVEIFSLVGLTYISSIENASTHENLFISFMVFSLVYMVFTCSLYYWGRTYNSRSLTQQEVQSLQLKIGLLLAKITSFLLAVYFYFRHNNHCEPGIYTWFAFWEYMTVIFNIAFHYTLLMDFGDYKVSIGSVTTTNMKYA